MAWSGLDFDEDVKKRVGPEVPEKAVVDAIGFYKMIGRTRSREDITECIQLAGYLWERLGEYRDAPESPSTNRGDSGQRLTPLTPGVTVLSAVRTRALLPFVLRLREDLFGCQQAPCASVDDIGPWVEQMTAQENAATHSPQQGEVMREALSKLHEITQRTAANTRLEFPRLPYPKAGGLNGYIVVCRHGRLRRLAAEARHMAEATGFSEVDVVAYVLADIPPCLAPYHISPTLPLWNKYGFAHRSVTITLNTPDITDEQLRSIRKEVRQVWESEREKAFGPHAPLLQALVAQAGEEPKKGKTAYWQRIRQEFNTQAGEQRYRSWKAAKNAHTAIQKKLQTDIAPVARFLRNAQWVANWWSPPAS